MNVLGTGQCDVHTHTYENYKVRNRLYNVVGYYTTLCNQFSQREILPHDNFHLENDYFDVAN